MKKEGSYYSTKYDVNNKILYKKKGWKEFKEGKIIKVNKNKKRSKVTYNIKLNKPFKKKKIYNKILSNRLKLQKDNEEDNIFNELKELIKTKKGKGKKAMEDKYKELCSVKEKKDKKKKEKQENKIKHKNLIKLKWKAKLLLVKEKWMMHQCCTLEKNLEL